MVMEEKLVEHFKLLNCKVQNEAALRKCIDICKLYELDEEEIAEKWVAYIVDATNGDLELDITAERLIDLEDWIKKSSKEPPEKKSRIEAVDEVQEGKQIEDQFADVVLKDEKEQKKKNEVPVQVSSNSSRQQLDDEDILEMYGYKKPAPKPQQPIPSSLATLRSFESLPLPHEPTKDLEKTERAAAAAAAFPEFDAVLTL